MDDFDYPNIQLIPSKYPIEMKRERRVIIQTKPIPQQMTSYYDKKTFNYQFMFVNVNANEEQQSKNWMDNQMEEQEKENKEEEEDGKEELNEKEKQKDEEMQQMQQISIHGWDQKNEKSEEKDKGQQIIQRKQNHKQQPSKTSQNILNDANINQQQNQADKSKSIQDSAISGLNQISFPKQVKIHKIINNQNSQHNFSQIPGELKNKQSQIDEIEDIEFQQEISAIKIKKNQSKGLVQLLNQLNENNQDGVQNEVSKKKQELKGLEFKNLIYRIKVQNCSKVCLRAIIDPFGKYIQSKSDKLLEYMKISKRKLSIESQVHDQILLWQVGEAKVVIEPVVLSASCCYCKSSKNVGIVSENYCSIICNNSECKKLITVTFVEILLYQA